MSTDDKKLQILSNEVKDSIEQLPIVTPELFRSIFEEHAKKNHIAIDDEKKLSEDIVKQQCSKLTVLQEQTLENANSLSESTSQAINAIQNKDEATLQHILSETKKLRAEVDKLKESLYRDELTHALNRKWMHDKCLIPPMHTFANSGTLAIIDLNYFKDINDTHGHIIGDKVLIFITQELKKIDHPIVRYGGDEFLILFSENVSISQAQESLSNLRESILKKKLKAHNTTFTVSFSFGITAFKKGDLLEHTVDEADKSMYEDKIEIKKRVKGI
jgi:diguanylate cyclase (GGDEF)-like protein